MISLVSSFRVKITRCEILAYRLSCPSLVITIPLCSYYHAKGVVVRLPRRLLRAPVWDGECLLLRMCFARETFLRSSLHGDKAAAADAFLSTRSAAVLAHNVWISALHYWISKPEATIRTWGANTRPFSALRCTRRTHLFEIAISTSLNVSKALTGSHILSRRRQSEKRFPSISQLRVVLKHGSVLLKRVFLFFHLLVSISSKKISYVRKSFNKF